MDEKTNYIDDEEREEVPNSDIEYHDNGVIKLERLKVTEKLIKHIHYDLRGQIKEVVDYDDLGNELNRLVLSKETAKNGLSFTYYPNGNVQSLKYFINGKINFVEKIYDEDGQLLEVITYNKGIKSGPHTIYSKRNAKLSEVSYTDNKPNGKAKYYFDTGELKAEVLFSEGKKDGVAKYFHKNGNLRKKENMKEGVRDGEVSLYYENGAIKEKYNYERGIRSKEAYKYNMDGEVISKKYFEEGEELADFPVEEVKEKEAASKTGRRDPYKRTIPQVVKPAANKSKETSKEKLQVEEKIVTEKKKTPVKKVLTKEELRRKKVKLAVNYSIIFVATLVVIYIVYNIIIYFI